MFNPLLNVFHNRSIIIQGWALLQTKGQCLARCYRGEMILVQREGHQVAFLAFVQSKNFSLMKRVVDVHWDQNSCISQLHKCIKNTFGSKTVCSCKAEVSNKWCRNYRIILEYFIMG